MDYIFLCLSLLSSLIISIALKYFEKWKYDRVVIIASNYAIASALGTLISKTPQLEKEALLYAIVVGLFFFVTFIVYSIALHKDGIAPAVTFGRISLAIPVTLSILLWKERPTYLNLLGLLLIFIVVLTWEGKVKNISLNLLLLFFLSGSIDTGLKYFKVKFPHTNEGKFLTILFLSSFIWSWLYVLGSRRKLKFKHILAGFFIGIPNFFSSFLLLKALSTLPAYISFPFITVGLIVFSSFLGYVIFSEKLTYRKMILIFFGILGILILNF